MTIEQKSKKRRSARAFDAESTQCVWMKAGIINYKLCDNAFDCLSCPFDKAMSRAIGDRPEAVQSWRKAMKAKPYDDRECRHMLTGRVQYHLCARGYECKVCEFDQYLYEADLASATRAVHANKVAGFAVADNYYYHHGHSWARLEHGGFVRLGIDDFALRLLGCPNQIQLPKLGSHLEQAKAGWSLEREGKTAAMLAPMDGVVVATNHKAFKQPEVAKKDPYGEGWLMILEPHGLRQNLKNLLFDQEAAAWIKTEAQKLEAMVSEVRGMPLAATGGEMVEDILGNVPQLKWESVVHEFLLT